MMSSSQNRTENRHIIWSDMNLNPDDWRDGYKDFLEINEIDGDPNDEHKLYEYMVETNGEYLSDERANLNIQLSQPIIVIGDIGRWNGRVMGYKMIDSGNIKDCLYLLAENNVVLEEYRICYMRGLMDGIEIKKIVE